MDKVQSRQNRYLVLSLTALPCLMAVDGYANSDSLHCTQSKGLFLQVLGSGGPVPALAYRINIGQHSIVFSGNQNGSSDAFLDFAHDTDVLLMHMPVPEGITGVGRKLHAPPSVIGNIAAKTGTAQLILSHFMARSLENIEKNLEEIQSRYSGSVLSAQDLDCIEF